MYLPKQSIASRILLNGYPRSFIPLELRSTLSELTILLAGPEVSETSSARFKSIFGLTLFTLVAYCCRSTLTMEQVEEAMSLPSRSGKIMLRCALEIYDAHS